MPTSTTAEINEELSSTDVKEKDSKGQIVLIVVLSVVLVALLVSMIWFVNSL